MENGLKISMALPFERTYNDVKLYGKRVKGLREEQKKTCREVASDIGIAHSIITKIETGATKKINLKHLELLSEYYGCTYMYLLGKCDSLTYYKDDVLYLNPGENIYLEDILHEIGFLPKDSGIDSLGEIVLDKIVRTYDSNNRFVIHYKRDRKFDKRSSSIVGCAKDNLEGIRVTIDGEHKIYLYYFTKKTFKVDLAATERTIADVGELENKRDSEYIIQEIVEREDVEDLLVVQDCRNGNTPARILDKTRSTTYRYQTMLNEIFYHPKTYNIKNIPIIELLYAMPHLGDDEIIELFVRILRMEEFYVRHSEQNEYGKVTSLMSDYLELFLTKDYEELKRYYDEIIMKNKK